MKVYVKLYATLAKRVSEAVSSHQHPQAVRAGARLEIELAEGSTLEDLVNLLGLPRELVKVIFVNGRAQQLEYRLEPGDEVGIFPPIAGG
jgi:molybdopterin converting factor small subunit